MLHSALGRGLAKRFATYYISILTSELLSWLTIEKWDDSVGDLVTLGFWGIDCLLLTGRGHPIAMVKSLEDYSHVKTRICQYEATKNCKRVEVAKTDRCCEHMERLVAL